MDREVFPHALAALREVREQYDLTAPAVYGDYMNEWMLLMEAERLLVVARTEELEPPPKPKEDA